VRTRIPMLGVSHANQERRLPLMHRMEPFATSHCAGRASRLRRSVNALGLGRSCRTTWLVSECRRAGSMTPLGASSPRFRCGLGPGGARGCFDWLACGAAGVGQSRGGRLLLRESASGCKAVVDAVVWGEVRCPVVVAGFGGVADAAVGHLDYTVAGGGVQRRPGGA
jgi:hypothetical protein